MWWISNQIGENGTLTGFERLDNTTARPFHPDPNHYKPASVTGSPASSYALAFTDPNFKFRSCGEATSPSTTSCRSAWPERSSCCTTAM
jgi:hypothetical protein